MSTTELFAFLNELSESSISYTLSQHRDDAIMISIAVPGERWEVEFFQDGHVEVEIFRSEGSIKAKDALRELIDKHSIKSSE